jgi:transposase-like protein
MVCPVCCSPRVTRTATRVGALQNVNEFSCNACGKTWAEIDRTTTRMSPDPKKMES